MSIGIWGAVLLVIIRLIQGIGVGGEWGGSVLLAMEWARTNKNRGLLVKTTGDGLLVEFASVVDALRCAAEMQTALAKTNAPLPPDRRIEFRVGINVGDVVVEDGDIFGDGVNVAARLEGLAEPGGICVSARVQEDAAGRLAPPLPDMGGHARENI